MEVAMTRGLKYVVVLLALLATAASAAPAGGIAGSTSRYLRRLEESVDLPYDSPYFAAPKGANPAQQVSVSWLPVSFIRLSLTFHSRSLAAISFSATCR